MTTLTVNIENKKTEKAVKAVLDAFGLDYDIDQHADAESGRWINRSNWFIND